MEKFVYFVHNEQVIECDIDITYKRFLGKIQLAFDLEDKAFTVTNLTEDNFYSMIMTEDRFNVKLTHKVEDSEKCLALKRINGTNNFYSISSLQEEKDFLLVYGFTNDHLDYTALNWGTYINDLSIVQYILEKDYKEEYKPNIYGDTPIIHAVYKGNLRMLDLLLEKNFENAHKANNDGNTPLHIAVRYNYIEIVFALLERDFDNAHTTNNDGLTPLDLAVSKGYNEIIDLLERDIVRRERKNY